MIRIPMTGPCGEPMRYRHIISANESEDLSRSEFFSLLRSIPHGEERVLPDFDDAIVYILPDTEQSEDISRTFCREADRVRKQKSRHAGRTVSLNMDIDDGEGNTFELSSTLSDDNSVSVEDAVLKQEEKEILRAAIAYLNEDDRRFILTRYGDDMNFVKLAELYDIDRHYASKRAGRIEERLRKIIEKI